MCACTVLRPHTRSLALSRTLFRLVLIHALFAFTHALFVFTHPLSSSHTPSRPPSHTPSRPHALSLSRLTSLSLALSPGGGGEKRWRQVKLGSPCAVPSLPHPLSMANGRPPPLTVIDLSPGPPIMNHAPLHPPRPPTVYGTRAPTVQPVRDVPTWAPVD
ncbi:hypothetical protein CDD83_5597 [Cordyceps sp. RAO-2017]|nr:hypothetical protein CDD83_5597 [Cordyceps sp. RAO-2017]